MSCYNCENNRRVYLRDCIGCAVRLVKAARPSRKRQDAMIDYLTRYGKFTKDEIVEALKK